MSNENVRSEPAGRGGDLAGAGPACCGPDDTGEARAQEEQQREGSLMGGCPMAAMCGRMAEKMRQGVGLKGLGLLPFVLGALLVALGVSVILEPLVLVWLAAVLLGLAGVSMIGMGYFVRRLFARAP